MRVRLSERSDALSSLHPGDARGLDGARSRVRPRRGARAPVLCLLRRGRRRQGLQRLSIPFLLWRLVRVRCLSVFSDLARIQKACVGGPMEALSGAEHGRTTSCTAATERKRSPSSSRRRWRTERPDGRRWMPGARLRRRWRRGSASDDLSCAIHRVGKPTYRAAVPSCYSCASCRVRPSFPAPPTVSLRVERLRRRVARSLNSRVCLLPLRPSRIMAASAPAADAALATKAANPRVWLDVSVDGTRAGRIVFELFADAVPKCVSLRARTLLIRLRSGLPRTSGLSVRLRT